MKPEDTTPWAADAGPVQHGVMAHVRPMACRLAEAAGQQHSPGAALGAVTGQTCVQPQPQYRSLLRATSRPSRPLR